MPDPTPEAVAKEITDNWWHESWHQYGPEVLTEAIASALSQAEARGAARERGWRPIETLPKTGQVLVTTEIDEGDGYGEIELVNCPMLKDGRTLNQNSGNYTRPNTWKWWAPVPPRIRSGGDV